MAINRAPFDALRDDDGSQLTGTFWDKAAIKNVLLDPVDAALAGLPTTYSPTPINVSTTGVQNALNPGLTSDTVILWAGAGDLTLNGLVGGVAGRRLTILNRAGTAATISVGHNVGSAAAGTRFSNYATSGPTPLAIGGSATWIYDPQYGGYWTMAAHNQGGWISPAFNAAFFVGVQGTWTVEAADVATHKYYLAGRTLHWAFVANNTTSAGALLQCTVLLPNGYAASGQHHTAAMLYTGSNVLGYLMSWPSTPNTLYFGLQSGTFPALTNGLHIQGSLTMEIS